MTPGPPAAGVAPVRMAVVGVGHLGRQHARVAARTPGVRLVGVHDRIAGRAEEVALAEATAVLPSREDVAETAEAVVIATPTASHAELATFFLERGLHVLVEKPMASSLREADFLVALARSRGRSSRSGTSSATTRRSRRPFAGSGRRSSSRGTGSPRRRRAASTSTSFST